MQSDPHRWDALEAHASKRRNSALGIPSGYLSLLLVWATASLCLAPSAPPEEIPLDNGTLIHEDPESWARQNRTRLLDGHRSLPVTICQYDLPVEVLMGEQPLG